MHYAYLFFKVHPLLFLSKVHVGHPREATEHNIELETAEWRVCRKNSEAKNRQPKTGKIASRKTVRQSCFVGTTVRTEDSGSRKTVRTEGTVHTARRRTHNETRAAADELKRLTRSIGRGIRLGFQIQTSSVQRSRRKERTKISKTQKRQRKSTVRQEHQFGGYMARRLEDRCDRSLTVAR